MGEEIEITWGKFHEMLIYFLLGNNQEETKL